MIEPSAIRSATAASSAIAPSSAFHSLPGSQLLQLVELTRSWGIDSSVLLADTGLCERALEEPNARVPVASFNRVVERARRLSGEPALGIFLGLRRRASMYGFLGFAAMSASTLREALELSLRFSSTVSTSIALYLQVEAGRAALCVEERVDVGDLRDVAMFALMIGLSQIGTKLTGRELSGGELHFAMPRPAYCDRFPELLRWARFDQPMTAHVFDARCLDWPLASADRASLRLAREQCELALHDRGLDDMLVERVRSLISAPEGVPALAEVATCMRLSARTLKRRLSARGVSFSELVEQERCSRARFLLGSSQLSLNVISERLGYSTLPNFARAFRRWTGETPAAYRRAQAVARASQSTQASLHDTR